MFKEIYELIEAGNFDINLAIHKPFAGKLAVSVLPKAPGLNLKPLVITGTPEELDAGFVSELMAAGKAAAGLSTNLQEFQATVAVEKDTVAKDMKKKTVKAKPAAAGKTNGKDVKSSAQKEMF